MKETPVMENRVTDNPLGLDGIEFVEFVSPDPEALHRLFVEFGFSRIKHHRSKKIDLYRQNDITFLLNREPESFAAKFGKLHGPSICSMGWRVKDVFKATAAAAARGAVLEHEEKDYFGRNDHPTPAIRGIGDSLIYLVDDWMNPFFYEGLGFDSYRAPAHVPHKGFISIDHLTNNVPLGTMKKWADFYKGVFGFTEVRYFDIRGTRTGLQSYALRSPCGKFCIPINEATEKESQINEYLREYNGPGIQHLAFLTSDIVASLEKLEGTSIQTLDIDDEYYAEVFDRVPGVTEDREVLRRHQILVDGDEDGYLLQIFTKNLVGPIFIEIIQRKNHLSFGEGNFQALFRSIERDQMKRGVFEQSSCGRCGDCDCGPAKAAR